MRRLSSPKKHSSVAVLAAFGICGLIFGAGILAIAQSIPSDEVRWTVRNYFPAVPGAIQVRTELVQADVVVRDGRGNLVGGLGENDFKIFDNGKEQKLSLFSVETGPEQPVTGTKSDTAPSETPSAPSITKTETTAKPRYIALLMDDTSMPNSDVVAARKAAEKFVRESLRPGDRAGVFTTSTQVTQMFTEDKAALMRALGKVVTHLERPDFGPDSCPRINPYQAYMLASFEAEHSPELDLALAEISSCPTSHCNEGGPSGRVSCIQAQARRVLALAERFGTDSLGIIDDVIRALSRQDGKRIVVLVSSGFWSQTIPKQRERSIDAALHAGVVINSLDAKGLDPDSAFGKPEEGAPIVLRGRGDLQELMQEMDIRKRDMYNDPMAQLADGTGGRFFHNNNDLGRGLSELAAVPEVSYVLGFSPAAVKPDGRFHELKVRVPGHGDFTVTARKGYFAPSAEGNIVATAPERRNELEREVMADDVKKAMPVDLNAAPSNAGGASSLKVDVQVGVQNLPFEQRDDRKAERLILITALFDAENHFLSGAEGILDLSLKEQTLKQLRATGVSAHMTLTAPAGKYRLREVVQEEGKGMMSAFSREVEIH